MTNFTFFKIPQACELKIKIRENICQIFKIVLIYVLIAEGLEVPGLPSWYDELRHAEDEKDDEE